MNEVYYPTIDRPQIRDLQYLISDGETFFRDERQLDNTHECLLALAFGDSLHQALVTITQALGTSFADHRTRFIEQWQHTCHHLLPGKEKAAGDDGHLYHVSHSMILAHEDKTYDGALIASLSIPWGEATSDDDVGGYHLVWTRDMCHSATGLLAAGDTEVPLRALIYLACTQKEDGGFYQNFWINGEPHWRGIQLDEVTAVKLWLKDVARARSRASGSATTRPNGSSFRPVTGRNSERRRTPSCC